MLAPTSFHVIGVRADGTIAVRLSSENLKKAKFLAKRLQTQHTDWKVRIEIPSLPR